MKTIWKFLIGPKITKIMMPYGAKVLTVAIQYGDVCIWAEVDSTVPLTERTFAAIGTGFNFASLDLPMNAEMSYIGTVQMSGGSLIWHIYEAKT